MRTPPTLTTLPANDTTIAVWDWAGPGQTLLFTHANGFHGRCWDQVIAHFPENRCLAVDLRGHGHSAKPAPPANWRAFGEDVAAVARAFDLHDAIGIGHSIGGHATALAAALAPDAFARLVLIDPVAFAPERYTGARTGEHFVAQRRNNWPSPDAMIARFADRPPFSRWAPGVLRDYCEYGLLPDPDGDGYILACPPTFEAGVYQVSSAVASNIYPEIARLHQHTLVVRAIAAQRTSGPDFSVSPTDPAFASHFPTATNSSTPTTPTSSPWNPPLQTATYIRTTYSPTHHPNSPKSCPSTQQFRTFPPTWH
ncbi:MAG: alpha/beta hydrolase [Thermomicrobiales bacterium]